MSYSPILVCGPPRSGTTWIARALATSHNTEYTHEPDNEKENLTAYILKKNLPRFPYLNERSSNKNYEKLFDLAFKGKIIDSNKKKNEILKRLSGITYQKTERRINTENGIIDDPKVSIFKLGLLKLINAKPTNGKTRKIVKSVHSILSLPFLNSNFEILPFIITRHPAGVISSYLTLQLSDAKRDITKQESLQKDYIANYINKIKKINTTLGKMALQLSIFHHVLDKNISEYQFFHIKHEDLLDNPQEQFKDVFHKLKLEWSQQTIDFLSKHNKEGSSGYNISRSAKKLKSSWKNIFTSQELEEIKTAYEILPNSFGYKFE